MLFMKRVNLFLILTCMTSFIGFSNEATAFPNCPGNHCSSVDEDMNMFCKDNGLAGKPFLVIGPSGKCFCPCSCMESNTFVATINSPFSVRIVELTVGESVLSPFSANQQSRTDQILNSDYTDHPGVVRHMKFSNGAELTVSPEHPFVAPGGRVLSAEELVEGQSVLDGSRLKVLVVENREQTGFSGRMMNLITNGDSSEARDHFVVINSILSGDWLIQSNYSTFHAEIDARLGKIKTFSKKGQ